MVQKEKIEEFTHKGKSYDIYLLREDGGIRIAAYEGVRHFPLTVCVSNLILEDARAMIRAGQLMANHPITLAISVVKSHVQAAIDQGDWPQR